MANIKISTHCAAFVLAAALSTTTHAATVQLQSVNNTVADGAIIIDADRTDWNGLTTFNADPNEGSTVDWSVVTIANDSVNFYVRYVMNASAGLNGSTMIFLDIDQNRDTGFIGGSASFSIGAEYMIQGASIYSFAGSTSTTWNWNSAGGTNYYTANPLDMDFSLARSAIGSPAAFNFLLLGEGDIAGNFYSDFYADSSSAGADGGYFTYTTVPEPTTTALLLGGFALAGLRAFRRLRRQ